MTSCLDANGSRLLQLSSPPLKYRIICILWHGGPIAAWGQPYNELWTGWLLAHGFSGGPAGIIGAIDKSGSHFAR